MYASDLKSLSLDLKVLENYQGLRILQTQSIVYYNVKSINSVTATVHEDMVKSVLLADVRYYLLIRVSK